MVDKQEKLQYMIFIIDSLVVEFQAELLEVN